MHGLLITMLGLTTLISPGDRASDWASVPLTAEEARLTDPVLLFAGLDERFSPDRILLRLVNPTGERLSQGPANREGDPERDPWEVIEVPGPPRRAVTSFRIESLVGGAWKEWKDPRTRASAPAVLPKSSRKFRLSYPPLAAPIRVRILVHWGAEQRWLVSPTIERPQKLARCDVEADGSRSIVFSGFDRKVEEEFARFALQNPTEEPLEFSGWDFGHPVKHPRWLRADGTWEESRRSVCGVGLRRITVPPGHAMPFLVRLGERRGSMQVGIRLDGELLWSETVELPSVYQPLGDAEPPAVDQPDQRLDAAHPVGPPGVTFEKLDAAFSNNFRVWWKLTNPTNDPLFVEGLVEWGGHPNTQVSIWNGSGWRLRGASTAVHNQLQTERVEMPARTYRYFSVQAYGTREPMRVRVKVWDTPDAERRWLVSDRADVPPLRR